MELLCRILHVSESGYYRYLKNLSKPSKDALLSAAIDRIMNESDYNDNYGVERMQLALEQNGFHTGKRRIRRIMHEKGLIHGRPRRPHGLTRAATEIQEEENLIKQDFRADTPYQKLLTDITQIGCLDGKLYISPIMDCFNGEILSLQMDDNMRKELCINTLKAVACRYPVRGATLHSDRGSQYTSEAFKKKLSEYGMLQSLSGEAHCYDNARMESFFATLKKELLYRIPTYRMPMAEVKSIIFRYVFIYYNRKRVYTSNPLGLPPAVYKTHYHNMYHSSAA